MNIMDSTAFLRGGISPTLPLRTTVMASGLPLTFRHNVSSVRLLDKKANQNDKQYGIRASSNTQRCNSGSVIRCFRLSRTPSGSRSGGFPSPNAKAALQSLLCFSLDTAKEEHTKVISAQKKIALQSLLAQKPEEAESKMTEVYRRYQKSRSGQIKYDATIALVEILIHVGTENSLDAAIGHLNDLEQMTENPPSDAKRDLYRAIIYTLLGEDGDAQTFWNTYTGTIGSGPPRGS